MLLGCGREERNTNKYRRWNFVGSALQTPIQTNAVLLSLLMHGSGVSSLVESTMYVFFRDSPEILLSHPSSLCEAWSVRLSRLQVAGTVRRHNGI